jgi:hypothetical protein
MAFSKPGPVIDAAITSLESIGTPLAAAGASSDVTSLPASFPEHIQSALAWVGSQYANSADYILMLRSEDIAEIEDALKHFKSLSPAGLRNLLGGIWLTVETALGLDGDMVSPETFPLANLGPRLRQARRDVYEGRGFSVIRGLDAQKYPVEDLTMIYLGVQSYVCSLQGRQDKKGNMLGTLRAPPGLCMC